MSIQLMSAVWGKQVSGATQTVLLVLCDFANDEGVCWPSQALVAWKAGCSDRTVRAVIAELEALGAVTTLESGQGRGRSSVLQIDLSALADKPELTSGFSKENRNPTSGFVTTKPEICDIKPEVATSDKPLEPSKRKKTKAKEIDLTGFAEWYALYPRKVNRVRAVEAWGKLSPDDRAAAMEALPRHVPVFANRDPENVPHPASWLNARRWEDVLPDPVPQANGHAPENRTRIDTEARFPDGTPCWLWLDNRVIDLRKPENAHYRERVAS